MSRVRLAACTLTDYSKRYSYFREPEWLLRFPQQPATGTPPEPDKSNPKFSIRRYSSVDLTTTRIVSDRRLLARNTRATPTVPTTHFTCVTSQIWMSRQGEFISIPFACSSLCATLNSCSYAPTHVTLRVTLQHM